MKEFSSQAEWEIVFAVRGMAPNQNAFGVGQCKFYMMNEEEFLTWGRRYYSGKYNPPNNVVIRSGWFSSEGQMKGQLVGAVRVNAIDPQHAESKGRHRIEEAINLLRYGQLTIGIPESPLPEVGLWVKQWWEQHCFVIRLDKPACSTNRSGGGSEGNVYTMSRRAPGWRGLEQIINIDLSKRSDIQLRITSALEWIGQAAMASNAPIRLVALVTALEALLIKKCESAGKKSKLSARVSNLTSQSDAERGETAKAIEEIYRTRSECVHGGLMDVERAEVDRTIQLVARTLEALVEKPPYSAANTLKGVRPWNNVAFGCLSW